jgi:flagellar basal-body rod protein FlgB
MQMFNNAEFKAMQKAMDMLWLKQKVISNNIANAETPGYKSKSVSFRNVLSSEYYRQNPEMIEQIETVVTVDDSGSIRVDGNNVDLEKESLELWRTYAQYSYLRERISGQFSNMRYVINNL